MQLARCQPWDDTCNYLSNANRSMCRPVHAEIRVHIPHFSKCLRHNRADRQFSATAGCYYAIPGFQNVTTNMYGVEPRNRPKMPLALVVVVWLRQCLRQCLRGI